eukprot:c7329_g1_i2.p1 GENE.c7329_g1_i2~~c7329_g1_i2.p1  ORF type:complete len:186 (-),score=36.73 c7329_g1_i2:75-632(-)
MYAAATGNVGDAQYLLDNGADPQVKSIWNETCLMKAAYNGHVEMCKLLVQHGVDVNARCTDGRTALEVAIIQKKNGVVAYLKPLTTEPVVIPEPKPAPSKKATVTPKPNLIPTPNGFYCPITHEIMDDPVTAEDGFTYERTAITAWLKDHNTSPMTREAMGTRLTQSHTVKSIIQEVMGTNREPK